MSEENVAPKFSMTAKLQIGKKRRRRDRSLSINYVLDEEILRTATYKPESRILCKDLNDLFYDAKVLQVGLLEDGSFIYVVHYAGWSSRFDVKVRQSEVSDRILPFTEENIRMAQELRHRAFWKRAPSTERKMRKKRMLANCTDYVDTEVEEKNSDVFQAEEQKCNDDVENQETPKENVTPEEEYQFELYLSDELERLLVYDKDRILNDEYVCRIPARNSVDDILQQYVEHLKELQNRQSKNITQDFEAELKLAYGCIDGIREYFNLYLFGQLLYISERVHFIKYLQRNAKTPCSQYINIYSDPDYLMSSANCKPSNVFGYIHLLRFFCKISYFLRVALWEPTNRKNAELIQQQLEKVLRFLDFNCEKFFDCEEDYVKNRDDVSTDVLLRNIV